MLRVQQIISESLTEGNRDICHDTRSMAVVAEMVVHPDPLLIFGFQFLPEVGKKIHLLLVLVQEIELAPDNGQLTFSPNGLCLSEFLLVGLFLNPKPRVVLEIDAKVVTIDVTLCHRIPEWRVVIQIKSYLPAFQLALSKKNFCGFHDRILFEKFIEFRLLIPDKVPFRPDLGHPSGPGLITEAFLADMIPLKGITTPNIIPAYL